MHCVSTCTKTVAFLTESKSDLDGQLKILEEKNTTLIQTNMELEEVISLQLNVAPLSYYQIHSNY